MKRIKPFFPVSHGIPRDADRRVVSGIVFVIRNGLRWRDAPPAYAAHTKPASSARGVTPCIPPCKNRKTVIEYDKALYRQRHRIENTFGRLKDWRRIAARYDRCAYTCFSAICIAATVIFWLGE